MSVLLAVLVPVLALSCVAVCCRALVVTIRADGLGTRPGPRSHVLDAFGERR